MRLAWNFYARITKMMVRCRPCDARQVGNVGGTVSGDVIEMMQVGGC